MICTQHWWSMFGMRNRHDWTFLQFAAVLLNVGLIYMTAGLVFPDFFGDAVVDLKQHFFAHRRWFFFLALGTVVASVAKEFVLDNRLPNTTNLIFHAIFAVFLLGSMLTSRQGYHKALVIVATALFIVYIFLLYVRLQ